MSYTIKDGVLDINIDLDLDICLFRDDDLDLYETEYLEERGYEFGEFVPIGKQRQEGFYVRKNSRESLVHIFLVHNIKQEIEKYTNDVWVFITKKPDIIFKNKKGKIVALEIETGKTFKRHKDRIRKKFAQVKKDYPNCYIVLTSTKKKNQYKRLITNIPIMVRTDIPLFLKKQFK